MTVDFLFFCCFSPMMNSQRRLPYHHFFFFLVLPLLTLTLFADPLRQTQAAEQNDREDSTAPATALATTAPATGRGNVGAAAEGGNVGDKKWSDVPPPLPVRRYKVRYSLYRQPVPTHLTPPPARSAFFVHPPGQYSSTSRVSHDSPPPASRSRIPAVLRSISASDVLDRPSPIPPLSPSSVLPPLFSASSSYHSLFPQQPLPASLPFYLATPKPKEGSREFISAAPHFFMPYEEGGGGDGGTRDVKWMIGEHGGAKRKATTTKYTDEDNAAATTATAAAAAEAAAAAAAAAQAATAAARAAAAAARAAGGVLPPLSQDEISDDLESFSAEDTNGGSDFLEKPQVPRIRLRRSARPAMEPRLDLWGSGPARHRRPCVADRTTGRGEGEIDEEEDRTLPEAPTELPDPTLDNEPYNTLHTSNSPFRQRRGKRRSSRRRRRVGTSTPVAEVAAAGAPAAGRGGGEGGGDRSPAQGRFPWWNLFGTLKRSAKSSGDGVGGSNGSAGTYSRITTSEEDVCASCKESSAKGVAFRAADDKKYDSKSFPTSSSSKGKKLSKSTNALFSIFSRSWKPRDAQKGKGARDFIDKSSESTRGGEEAKRQQQQQQQEDQEEEEEVEAGAAAAPPPPVVTHSYFLNSRCKERPLPAINPLEELQLIRECLEQLRAGMRANIAALRTRHPDYTSAVQDIKYLLGRAEELKQMNFEVDLVLENRHTTNL